MFKKPILYYVTPELDENVEKWIHVIKEAVIGGVNVVQIRDKKSTPKILIEVAKQIQPFLKKHRVPLIINDYVDIAKALQSDGVHLGQSDLSISKARALLGSKAIIGLSVETPEQVLRASSEQVNYLAASPIFSTQTKTDCSPPIGLKGFTEFCSISSYPMLAIGGIYIHNVEQVLKAGGAGVAVISAIFKAPCPQKAAREFIDKMLVRKD